MHITAAEFDGKYAGEIFTCRFERKRETVCHGIRIVPVGVCAEVHSIDLKALIQSVRIPFIIFQGYMFQPSVCLLDAFIKMIRDLKEKGLHRSAYRIWEMHKEFITLAK